MKARVSLLSEEGLAALAGLMRRRALLAFDFDGTITAIRPTPGEVRVEPALAVRMAALARRQPLAIVTGRRVTDVRARLGFEPTYIVGNHGAEDESRPAESARWLAALEPLRAALRESGDAIAHAGILVEDKGQSLALHYRNAIEPELAHALIVELLAAHARGMHVFGGKLVLNVTAIHAPDKAHAVHDLLLRSGAETAVFVGDDVNDEPVFQAAETHWLTARVGADI
ncbi:MAG TPA: trehalose-phosphatase, partial [Burkholderiaceae bacterium]|nr:trehalose-phosphatase [Burkholderiaceae bacterium]